jgi:hypothetical protein
MKYGIDLVGLAHTPQFYPDYRDWLIEGGYDPEIDRFDSRHEPLAIDFFETLNSEA